MSALPPLRALLLDLDGVLYVGDDAVEGAPEAVERVRSAGLDLRFVTNTTAHSRAATLEKLRRLGFPVADAELVAAAALAEELCLSRGHSRVSMLIQNERAGVHIEVPKDKLREALEADG